MKIIKNNKILIRGQRTDNGLWKIPIDGKNTTVATSCSTAQDHVANSVIKLDTTKGELAHYYASTFFNPTKSTLLRATHRNHFTTWPAMNTKLIRKHLNKRLPTVQGHLDQEFKNIRSAKEVLTEEEEQQDIAPSQEPNNIKTNDI